MRVRREIFEAVCDIQSEALQDGRAHHFHI